MTCVNGSCGFKQSSVQITQTTISRTNGRGRTGGCRQGSCGPKRQGGPQSQNGPGGMFGKALTGMLKELFEMLGKLFEKGGLGGKLFEQGGNPFKRAGGCRSCG